MAQGCLKCLKYTMCVANFLCFMCGVAVLGLGVYMTISFKMVTILPSLAKFSVSNALLITGIIITCLSFLGFLGALKENRCLLLTFFLMLFLMMLVELTVACLLLMYEQEIGQQLEKDLLKGFEKVNDKNNSSISEWDVFQELFHCCGVNNKTTWTIKPISCCRSNCGGNTTVSERIYWKEGCLDKAKKFFEDNFLHTGISVIVLCIVEVLGMCFAMTLFCHISRSGLGYKL